MKKRHGISLVELLLTLSACTVILTMSAMLIHRVMHAQSSRRAVCDLERAALRLATVFRADVHQARELLESEDGVEEELLRLQLADGQTIQYRHVDDTLQRLAVAEDTVVARDAFRFTPEAEIRVERNEADVVTLSITSQPHKEPRAAGKSIAHRQPVEVRLAALLGRDRPSIQVARSEEARP